VLMAQSVEGAKGLRGEIAEPLAQLTVDTIFDNLEAVG